MTVAKGVSSFPAEKGVSSLAFISFLALAVLLLYSEISSQSAELTGLLHTVLAH